MGLAMVAAAQVVPPSSPPLPPSEVPIPPKPKTDSTAPKPDTIKARFGRASDAGTSDVGPQYSWNREELFASGALSLADLLERIPGVTSFRSGWMASPKFAAVNGDLNRIRVYYDGIALDNLDARTEPLLDLNTVQLWTLESVTVERLGGELRVNVRSWQVERTTPYTRTDVYTGTEDTNIYRGYYGKRYGNGAGLQLAGQQFNTVSNRLGGGGDALAFLARVGIAKKLWSVDAFANRAISSRSVQPTFGPGLAVPNYSSTSTMAYLRGAFGKVDDGPWIQVIASSMKLEENSKHATGSVRAGFSAISDTTDTTSHRQQYLLSAGFTRGPVRASVSDRIRAVSGETTHVPDGRFIFDTPYAFVSLFGEKDDFRKVNRVDATARLMPLSFVALAASVSRISSTLTGPAKPHDFAAARAEVGVRLLGSWLLGGIITRDTTVLSPLRVFDSAYVSSISGRRTGAYVGLRGKIYKDLGTDIVATRWDSADAYRPRYQARSELNLDTRWLSRFPSGNFGLRLAAVHEYRDEISFPVAGGIRTTAFNNVFSGLIEIRILHGIISYQVRNMAGELYQVIPDFYMPRAVSIYGVRWEFWN
jgi:TonB-dependent Receptor Plug Domain